jgi:hypothetical protein
LLFVSKKRDILGRLRKNMAKRRSIQSPLKALYQEDPNIVQSVLKALNDELNITANAPLVSFECPNCDTPITVSVGAAPSRRSRRIGGPAKRRKSNFASGLNLLVLRAAKLRGTMVANIHSDFTRLIGGKAKARTMPKEVYRQRKERWLKSEIAKYSRRRKISAA